ncbi:methionine--tRNA ligase [Candidatus Micrarchaeota archaeon]|nr:methionine--tRNA ligase [Candidatus Micrarchaeota archaeon]
MKNKILITSALPYVNNVPHLGNIVGCVLSADVYARYCRSKGEECIYICGTDEYGTATEIKALEEGLTPQQICDKYHKIHKEIYEWFGISFDYFGRTSTPIHSELTQEIFLDLKKNDYIIEEENLQYFDEKADMFLADRYIEGTCPFCNYDGARGDQCDKCGKLLKPEELKNPISKVSKTTPTLKSTKHLYINLPGIENELAPWIDKTSKEGKWSQNTTKIAQSWIKEGIKKRAITRDLKWGVKIPETGYENKVFYVWFDAPIGYISITAGLTPRWKEWWLDNSNVRLYQFMGKDNVPFHTVIFPATLLGTKKKWTMVHHINTTEFLNYEGGKFSKSRKTGVFGDDAVRTGIPADVWRYYLMANRPEQADTMFSWEDFADKNNNELLANLGNLVNRTLVFVKNNFGYNVPKIGELTGEDRIFLEGQQKLIEEIGQKLENVELKDSLHRTMNFSKNANKYFQDNKPWELVKTNRERAETVMGILSNQIRILAILIEPHLPFTSSEIFRQLNLKNQKWDELTASIPADHQIGEPKALFRKIEQKEVQELRKKHAGGQTESAPKFEDLDLEVGEIIEVQKHPNAEKLYVEKIRLSDGVRQIVSGLVDHHKEEELMGKRVVVLRNLKPAALRGIESEGMILAAENKEGIVEALMISDEIGTKIVKRGEVSKPKQLIDYKEFSKVKIMVKDHLVVCDGKQLVTEKTEVRTNRVKEGEVA